MNEWDYHKNEFIKLGGIVENLTCRDGSNGRGIFREGNNRKPKILCPAHLLTKVEDITLADGKFRLKEGSGHSPEAIEFIENYYQNFSWEESGREEARKFLEEISQIPEEAKILLLNNKLCPNVLLSCEPNLQLSFQRFAGSRSVSFQNKSVLAPIWELVNHSPFARLFKISKNGAETPTYPLVPTTNEIFFSYQIKTSPISIFFNYGFASNEIFAYSLPAEIKVANSDLTIRINGEHRGVENNDRKVLFKENTLTIPALPLGSFSKKLPTAFFHSIVQKYGVSESKASGIIYQLQLVNAEQRKRLSSLLLINPNDTAQCLIESIRKEIALIESSLQAD